MQTDFCPAKRKPEDNLTDNVDAVYRILYVHVQCIVYFQCTNRIVNIDPTERVKINTHSRNVLISKTKLLFGLYFSCIGSVVFALTSMVKDSAALSLHRNT